MYSKESRREGRATLMFPVVTSADCLLHEPLGEIWLGTNTPGTEVAERATVILSALEGAGHSIVDATPHDDAALTAVHDPSLVDYLRTAWSSWDAAGYPSRDGANRVVPYLFPLPGLTEGLPVRTPTAPHARAGIYCYDTMTLIGPGTWEATRAAVDCTLTAVDLVSAGAAGAYALTRPPGHHVTRTVFGGSCYLNNAAIAAQSLRDRGAARVAVIDIDAHHGNGTQSIFYSRNDVFVTSLHIDPAAGWFPHHAGFADEIGIEEGRAATLNIPLAEGTGDEEWLAALARMVETTASFNPDAVVVSLGVDAAADDPESPLRVTAAGYRSAGALIAALDRPIVAVQEGGYHLPTLGDLVAATLGGLAGTAG